MMSSTDMVKATTMVVVVALAATVTTVVMIAVDLCLPQLIYWRWL